MGLNQLSRIFILFAFFSVNLFGQSNSFAQERNIVEKVDTSYYNQFGLHELIDSVADGKWVMYYNNNKVFARYTVKENKIDDKACYYWWNGQLFITTSFVNGKINGKRILYNIKGTKFFEGYWTNGLKNGKFKYYLDNGKQYREEKYVDDILMETKNK